MNEKGKLSLIIFTASSILILLILAFHCYSGFFSRLMCDEFVIFNVHKTGGFWGSFEYWFFTFTGRFSLIVTYILLAASGPKIVPFLTTGMLLIWITGSTWACSNIFKSFNVRNNRSNILFYFFLSLFIIYVTLDIAPNIYQSLYWAPGMLTYIFPLFTMTIHAGLIAFIMRKSEEKGIKKPALAFRIVFIFLLSLISGGFSETQTILVIGLSSAAIFFEILWGTLQTRRILRPLLYSSLVGSILAMLIQFLSPGTQNRQTKFTVDKDIFSIILNSVNYTFKFLWDIVSTYPESILMTLIGSVIVFMLISRRGFESLTDENGRNKLKLSKLILVFLLYAAIGFLLLVGCMIPSFYATSMEPIPRLLVIPGFMFIIEIVLMGYGVSIVLNLFKIKRTLIFELASMLAVVFLILAVSNTWVSYSKLKPISVLNKRYAYDWDRREESVKAAKKSGSKSVTVMPLRYYQMTVGLDELSTDPGFWVNRMVAEYYGLDSIKTKKIKDQHFNH